MKINIRKVSILHVWLHFSFLLIIIIIIFHVVFILSFLHIYKDNSLYLNLTKKPKKKTPKKLMTGKWMIETPNSIFSMNLLKLLSLELKHFTVINSFLSSWLEKNINTKVRRKPIPVNHPTHFSTVSRLTTTLTDKRLWVTFPQT